MYFALKNLVISHTIHYLFVEESLLYSQSTQAPSTQAPSQELRSLLIPFSFGERPLFIPSILDLSFERMVLVPAITCHSTLFFITLIAVFNYIFTWVNLFIACFHGVRDCFIVYTVTTISLPHGRYWVNLCWVYKMDEL